MSSKLQSNNNEIKLEMKTKYFTQFFATSLLTFSLNLLYIKPAQASLGNALADLGKILPDLAGGLVKNII